MCEYSDLSNLRVLIVDDDLDTRDLLGFIFEQYQAKITLASSAHEAYEAITQASFDLLLSDVSMPGEDGYSLIRKIRTLSDVGSRIPAIALTAFSNPEEQAEALAAGFNCHVAKPVDPDHLLSVAMGLINSLDEA